MVTQELPFGKWRNEIDCLETGALGTASDWLPGYVDDLCQTLTLAVLLALSSRQLTPPILFYLQSLC